MLKMRMYFPGSQTPRNLIYDQSITLSHINECLGFYFFVFQFHLTQETSPTTCKEHPVSLVTPR